jgi:hypothetical protein
MIHHPLEYIIQLSIDNQVCFTILNFYFFIWEQISIIRIYMFSLLQIDNDQFPAIFLAYQWHITNWINLKCCPKTEDKIGFAEM